MDKDDRFKHIATDPKFRRIPKAERKVKIDKRFQSMFKDKKFKLKYTIDKRGRPVNHTSTEDLKRYYELSSEDESDSSEEESESENKQEKAAVDESAELNKKIEVDKNIPDKVKVKLKNFDIDYARGEGTLVSESSSDDDSESEVSEDDEIDHEWGELDKDAEKTDDVTNKLAVCNMDWDRIRAVDLMVLFNSFLPAGGVIHSVTIYPSDFGIQRMKEEEIKGPIELTADKQDNEESGDEQTEEGSKYHMEKLRQYQLNRLKYYYAVVVCDSPETANKIYTECDGLEYESSATKIDLRFVPDGTEFENEPKEVCNKMPERYQPRFFTTTALQQAKVELTWDETNPERLEIAKKLSDGKVDDVTDADLQAYLASSSGEESAEEENENSNSSNEDEDSKNPIDKYRALLQDIENVEKEKENKGVEMEVTWGLNLKEKSQKLVKQKLASSEDKTPFEQFLAKRKEKIKTKREERKKKLAENKSDDSNDETSDDVPSDVDMNDPYFAEEFDKPEFKKKKQKSKKSESTNEESTQEKAELELLLLNENEDGKKHFSLKKIQDQESGKSKKKRKNKKNKSEENNKIEDDFELDVKDDRFSALYSSHHYNIDPTDPHFRKTKAMDALITEKLKRRGDDIGSSTSSKKPKEEKKDVELSVLVKSVKRKTQAMTAKK